MNKNNLNTINDRIKYIRQDKGLSQRSFGEKIFLSQDQISLIELGKRNPIERTINDICRVFNVNENWIKNGIGDVYTDLLEDIDVSVYVKRITNKILKLSEDELIEMEKKIDSILKEYK